VEGVIEGGTLLVGGQAITAELEVVVTGVAAAGCVGGGPGSA